MDSSELVLILKNTDAESMINDLADSVAHGVIADPPWAYSRTGGEGSVGYSTEDAGWIADLLDLTWPKCLPNAYLIVWCTWPKLQDWMDVHRRMRWTYKTGGAWTKSNGFGVGYHHAGDSEYWLLYTKGSPRPAEGRQSNAVHANRVGHSEKPQEALDLLVRTVAPEGGLIIDPFAGESASLARCAKRLGRSYIGSEMDADRHATALKRLGGASRRDARRRNTTSMFDLMGEAK